MSAVQQQTECTILVYFAGLKAERAQFADVSRALEKVALERGLQLHQNWLNKCIQLYETYLVCLDVYADGQLLASLLLITLQTGHTVTFAFCALFGTSNRNGMRAAA
jgi:hypothetical protein